MVQTSPAGGVQHVSIEKQVVVGIRYRYAYESTVPAYSVRPVVRSRLVPRMEIRRPGMESLVYMHISCLHTYMSLLA